MLLLLPSACGQNPFPFINYMGIVLLMKFSLKSITEPITANVAVKSCNVNNPSSKLQSNNFSTSTNYNNHKKRDLCQICNLNNHNADRCRKQYQESQNYIQQHQNPQAHLMYIGGPSTQQTTSSGDSNATWYPDIGASYHVTPNLSSLSLASSILVVK